MFDLRIRRRIDPLLDVAAARLVAWGVGANQMTLFGFAAGMGGAACVAAGWFPAALGLVVVNRTCDGLDGAIARQSTPTDLGGYLDIVLDLLFYSAIPFAFALYDPKNALAAAFLIYSFIGTGGSFLAFAILTAKRGSRHEATVKKSFFYSVGLIEGTETVLFLLAVCGWPAAFQTLAWTFGSLCWVTTALRIHSAVISFRD